MCCFCLKERKKYFQKQIRNEIKKHIISKTETESTSENQLAVIDRWKDH